MNDPVIDATDLADLREVRLLDARGEAAFAAGHGPGAVRVPVERWVAAAKTGEKSLDRDEHWRGELAELGVPRDATAVVYDDGRMTEAARVWFILQNFGVPALVLNGGWPALAAGTGHREGRTAAGSATPRPPAAGLIGLVGKDELKAALGDGAIFDSRTAAEYSGEDLKSNTRGGHLPGARLLPHADLLDGAFLKPASDLRALLDAAGFRPGERIVTHCDGGGRAALAAIAALRAGYGDVAVYYLSFADWAKDESCPVVRRS